MMKQKKRDVFSSISILKLKTSVLFYVELKGALSTIFNLSEVSLADFFKTKDM